MQEFGETWVSTTNSRLKPIVPPLYTVVGTSCVKINPSTLIPYFNWKWWYPSSIVGNILPIYVSSKYSAIFIAVVRYSVQVNASTYPSDPKFRL